MNLAEIKDYKEFKRKIGDPVQNWKVRDKWIKERFKVGMQCKFDASEYMNSYPRKHRHMKKCEIVEISGDLAYVKFFKDGKIECVLAEYLLPIERDEYREGIFAFGGKND